VGTTSPTHFLINSVTVSGYSSILFFRGYPEHIPVCLIKTILKHGLLLVRPALTSTYHEYFLFEFLPTGREEQNGVMIRFAEGITGEGLVGVSKS
jgi:hypothetical protein